MRPGIEGWTTEREAAELARLAPGKVVLEVGTYKGFGAVLMAQAGAVVWAVDWHRGDSGGDPALGQRDTLCAWWTSIRRHHVEDQVVGLVGRSSQVLTKLRPALFDMAFVDADHAYLSVAEDISLVRPLLKPGGVLVFHDYSTTWPGVRQAVDELRADLGRGYPMRIVGSLAVLELPIPKESLRAL